jgi:hypothetical protein
LPNVNVSISIEVEVGRRCLVLVSSSSGAGIVCAEPSSVDLCSLAPFMALGPNEEGKKVLILRSRNGQSLEAEQDLGWDLV